MKLPRESKFQRWKYVEVARYVPSLKRVIREKHGDEPVLLEWHDVAGYSQKNGNTGIYTSVFHYDNLDLSKATRLGSLYFDLDSSGGAGALDDTKRLVDYLRGFISSRAIRIYFTGAKGFHVECEAIALGIGPTNDLSGHFRYVAQQIVELLKLTTVDFSVYDLRRMWRLPNSRHQTTGLYKVALAPEEIYVWSVDHIKQIATAPSSLETPDQEFEPKANEWYREWSYKREAVKTLSMEDRIARFEQYGAGLVYEYDDSDLEFDPVELFSHCPSVLRLWEQAEQDQDLPHEARLFLCSLLTYTKEAEWYLHKILSNCEDYNAEKSQAHIADWIKRRELGIGGRPYTCDRANAAGVGCGECNLEPREKLERVGDQLIRTGEPAPPSPFRFAYKRKKKDGYQESIKAVATQTPTTDGKDNTDEGLRPFS